jgi:hypothetical protein
MRNLLILLPVFLVVSCASDKQSAAPASTGRKTMNERFNSGPSTITQNSKGEYPDEVRKEFALEGGRQSSYFNGESSIPKTYKAGEYAKTTWWGKKEYTRQAYAGDTDGSRFQTTARDQGAAAREANTAARMPDPYSTGTYQTGAAREAGVGRYPAPTNAQIEARRQAYPEPEVVGWKQLRAIDMKTTRSILGRE